MREKAELAALLPFSAYHVRPVAHQVSAQGKDQSECMLRHGVYGVPSNIRNSDVSFRARRDIDDVITCRCNRNHFQPGQLAQCFRPNWNFVRDRNIGVLKPFDCFVGRRSVVCNPFMLVDWTVQLNRWANRVPVQKYDVRHRIVRVQW